MVDSTLVEVSRGSVCGDGRHVNDCDRTTKITVTVVLQSEHGVLCLSERVPRWVLRRKRGKRERRRREKQRDMLYTTKSTYITCDVYS